MGFSNGAITPGVSNYQISHAIADRAIAVRVTIDSLTPGGPGQIVEGAHLIVPQHLSPVDFDWTGSRPLAPWLAATTPSELYIPSWSWVPCSIGLVEVFRADVSSIWCRPVEDQEHSSPEAATRPSLRGPPAPARLQQWYETRVRDWPQGKKHPSPFDDWEAAQAEFPMNHVTRDSIRALRRKHAPAEWTAHGRRPARE